MRMQIFRVKKPSCKILKTKNCAPFEVPCTSNPVYIYFCGRVPWLYQYWLLWFFVQELPKAQPAVVLVLKRLRRRSNGLKSHLTDWEKPGIEPAIPFIFIVCGRVPWLYQYWPGGFKVLWFYVQELPKAQPAVVLVLKHLRRQGNSLKSHPTDWEKPGIEPATPGLQDTGLSPTLRRLL